MKLDDQLYKMIEKNLDNILPITNIEDNVFKEINETNFQKREEETSYYFVKDKALTIKVFPTYSYLNIDVFEKNNKKVISIMKSGKNISSEFYAKEIDSLNNILVKLSSLPEKDIRKYQTFIDKKNEIIEVSKLIEDFLKKHSTVTLYKQSSFMLKEKDYVLSYSNNKMVMKWNKDSGLGYEDVMITDEGVLVGYRPTYLHNENIYSQFRLYFNKDGVSEQAIDDFKKLNEKLYEINQRGVGDKYIKKIKPLVDILSFEKVEKNVLVLSNICLQRRFEIALNKLYYIMMAVVDVKNNKYDEGLSKKEKIEIINESINLIKSWDDDILKFDFITKNKDKIKHLQLLIKNIESVYQKHKDKFNPDKVYEEEVKERKKKNPFK